MTAAQTRSRYDASMLRALKNLARPIQEHYRLRGARARNQQKLGAGRSLRWGILGTGAMARAFADGLSDVPGAHLAAIGSRDAASARAAAHLLGAPRSYGSYAALAADPDIDVVYVATLNARHHDDVMLCLTHGKPVLCEKPFALNGAEAEAMVAEARTRGLFLMEAMWTRFLPSMAALRDTLAASESGAARSLTASFGFRAPIDPSSRLYDPAKGGGALLDVGVYPLSLAITTFGVPDRVEATLRFAATGVDVAGAATLHFDEGRRADLTFSITEPLANDAVFVTSTGRVVVDAPFWNSTRITCERAGEAPRVLDCPPGRNGYTQEAAAVTACIRAGQLEEARMPLDDTLAVIRTVDRIRAAAP